MGFVKKYEHDVFVSYAHGPVPLGNFGSGRVDPLSKWTMALVDDVRGQVDFYLDTKKPDDRAVFWMDPELEGNLPLTDNLRRKVERSALLLVVMSSYYLQSSWCGDEVAWFSGAPERRDDMDGRLFVVRAVATDEAAWPKALKDTRDAPLSGYRFHPAVRPGEICEPHGWPVPEDTDSEYHDLVGRLARDIVKQLQQLSYLEKKAAAGAETSVVPKSVGRQVFLGYMHDTLSEGKEDVPAALRAAFDAAKLTVLPPAGAEPTDEASLRRALETYLPQSEAFVLVANEYPGKWPVGQAGGCVGFQLGQAKACRVPAFLWLRVPDLSQVRRDEYRTYIEQLQNEADAKGLPLRHADVAGFVGSVLASLDKATKVDPGVERLAVVCANRSGVAAGQERLMREIAQIMEAKELPNWIAPVDPETGQIRLEKLKDFLDQADTILIVCFDQNYQWANRLWGQIKSSGVIRKPDAKRIFVVGPKDDGSGVFNLPRFNRFDKSDGTPLDPQDPLAAAF